MFNKYAFSTSMKLFTPRNNAFIHKKYAILLQQKTLDLLKNKLGLLEFLFSNDKLKKFDQSQYQKFITINGTTKREKGYKTLEGIKQLNTQDAQLVEVYINYLYNQYQWEVVISRQLSKLTDLSTPHKWYSQTRKMKRKFIFHHGPTNSGKTVSAVKALQKQKQNIDNLKGIYMAPLRLLAWQIQQRLAPCTLITGQQKIVMDSNLTSCTIQTANLLKNYKLAVIDEIQMIGDSQRGWAWTKAILSVKAEQIHLCGESRPLELISKICSITGDILQQRRYPRLSRLLLENKLIKYKDLKPGDCVIAFSTSKLHQIRSQISKIHNKNVAIIYGRLPPQIRKKQAQQFNNGTLPFLVSTNAIGMGLNLQIKRIIFYETQKVEKRNAPKKPLDDFMIQQIAGRAGRGLTDGYVYCMNYTCLQRVRKALKHVNKTYNIKLQIDNEQTQTEDIKQIKVEEQLDVFLKRNLTKYQKSMDKGVLFIEFNHLQMYYYMSSFINQNQVNEIKLSNVIKPFFHDANTNDHYSILEADKFLKIVKQYQQFGLSALDSFHFANVPETRNQKQMSDFMTHLAKKFIQKQEVNIPLHFLKYLQKQLSLKQLQNAYSLLQTYVWLSNKYDLAFRSTETILFLKQDLCKKIQSKLKRGQKYEKY